MPTVTKEAAFKACIERSLSGEVSTPTSNDGKIQEDAATYKPGKGVGYFPGQYSDFKPDFALDVVKFWQFLEAIQAAEHPKLRLAMPHTGEQTKTAEHWDGIDAKMDKRNGLRSTLIAHAVTGKIKV